MATPAPDIAVLMPVYDAAATLPAAIDSILAQEFGSFELIVIDDGSRDESWTIIEAYAARDPRVRALRNPRNRGLPGTLNAGLAAARADLVARMDADDVALPRRLGAQYQAMRDDPATAVLGSAMTYMGVDERRDILIAVETDPDLIARRLPETNCMLHPTVMLRRAAILDLGGYRTEFKNAEDYDLWLRVIRGHRMRNLAQPLLRYRLSSGGQTVARFWDQMLYIELAKLSYAQPDVPLEALLPEAAWRRDARDRRREVAQATKSLVRSLSRLGHHRQALDLLWRSRGELDRWLLARAGAKTVARALLPPW